MVLFAVLFATAGRPVILPIAGGVLPEAPLHTLAFGPTTDC